MLEYLPKAGNIIVDAGAAQATPHLTLVTGDHRLTDERFDFFDDFQGPNATATQKYRVGVGPIELPAHLDRSQIVTRATDYKLNLSESHQWAEPLKDSVSRVIAINLSNMLESNRVFVIPRRQKMTLDFQVSIDIARFDGRLGESAALGARWTLYGRDTREPLLSKVTIVYEETEDGTYDALVAASSRTLEVLSTEIADAIKARKK